MSKMSERNKTTKERILFALSAIPDQMTYQAFNLFVFTYYFAVVKIPPLQVMLVFILWGIWNAVNDPLIGALSERTKYKKKYGKRRFFLIISIIPLSIIMVLLFCVFFSTDAKIIEFIYFISIIMIFELFYTMWDCNLNALFPEIFPTEEERAKTNVFIKAFTVIAVILASVPSIILSPLAPETGTPEELMLIKMNYFIGGIMLAVLTMIFAIPFLLWGFHEKEETQEDFEKRPGFLESLKITFSNRTFLKFTTANMMVWYVFNILMTILPLFSVHILKIGEKSFLLTLQLLLALGIAAFMLPVHRRLGRKFGMRNSFMATLGVWIILLFPYMLLNQGDLIFGLIITALQGIPLGGALFYVDILHSDVIDEDAVRFGVKRSASYYGVNGFIHRFSIILTYLTIGSVFQGTGWAGGYVPNPGIDVIIGIKLIMFLFPSIGCGIAIFLLYKFDLHGERLNQMREKLKELNL